MGYLNLTKGNDTEIKTFYNSVLSAPLNLTGNFVKDVISPSDNATVNYTYQKNISYEFFLVQKVEGIKSQLDDFGN